MGKSAPPPPPATSAARTLSHALNEKIRERLTEKGWSQRDLGDRLGVTQGAVSYQLAAKRRAAVLDYYERLAQEVFGTSLSVLIADLETRVAAGGDSPRDPPGTGAPPAGVAPSVPPDLSTDREALVLRGREAVVLRAFFEAYLDTRQTDAQIDARMQAVLAHLDTAVHQRAQPHKAPKVPRPSRRSVPPPRAAGAAAGPEPEDAAAVPDPGVAQAGSRRRAS